MRISLLEAIFNFINKLIIRLVILSSSSKNYSQLKKEFDVKKTLDFPDRKIFIKIDSDLEYIIRANSCVKEPFTVDWIRKIAHKGIFYDIGANVGSYSLIAASLMSNREKVVAFEPAYFNFYKLNENIKINNLNNKIIPLNIALTDNNSVTRMYFSSVEEGSAFHSLGGGNRIHSYFINIMCMTLDDVVNYCGIPFPNHIKIDVDGTELAILNGGRTVFRNNQVKSVMVEFDEINQPEESSKKYKFFNEMGYIMAKKYRLPMSKAKIRFNVLFMRKSIYPT